MLIDLHFDFNFFSDLIKMSGTGNFGHAGQKKYNRHQRGRGGHKTQFPIPAYKFHTPQGHDPAFANAVPAYSQFAPQNTTAYPSQPSAPVNQAPGKASYQITVSIDPQSGIPQPSQAPPGPTSFYNPGDYSSARDILGSGPSPNLHDRLYRQQNQYQGHHGQYPREDLPPPYTPYDYRPNVQENRSPNMTDTSRRGMSFQGGRGRGRMRGNHSQSYGNLRSFKNIDSSKHSSSTDTPKKEGLKPKKSTQSDKFKKSKDTQDESNFNRSEVESDKMSEAGSCDKGRRPKNENSGQSRKRGNRGEQGGKDKDQFGGSLWEDKVTEQDKEKDNDSSVSSVGMLTKKLIVSLNFKSCFENVSTLEKLITSNINFPPGKKFELQFDETRLRHSTKEAYCQFTIFGQSIIQAKFSVKNMVDALQKKLKATIDLLLDIVNENDDRKTEGNIERHGKKGATHQQKNEGVEKDGPQPKNKSDESKSKPPVPTTVFITVEENFSSPSHLERFLRNVTSDLPFEIDIIQSSLAVSGQTSTCSVKTRSKADAGRLTHTFHEFKNKTKVNITCATVRSNSIENKNAPNRDNQKVKLYLENSLSKMTEKKCELLKNHADKISQLRKELLNSSSLKQDNDARQEFAVIQEKLTMANLQEEIFFKSFQPLYKRLEQFEQSMATFEDIKHVMTILEIECERFKKALPIYVYKNDITKMVKENQVSVIACNSGCGKSTQIAQFLFDDGYSCDGIIAHVHPETIFVLANAEQVAQEMKVKIGTLVGLKTLFDKRVNHCTKILYTTDQSMINDFHEDGNLRRYSCIIIDDAHCHRLYTDLILGMLKPLLRRRPDLKLIILSTQSRSGFFTQHFMTGHEIQISGQRYPVKTFHVKDAATDSENHIDRAVSIAVDIHCKEDQGDVLVFVGSPEQSVRCCTEFQREYKGHIKFTCLALNEELSQDMFRKIFDVPSDGQRKIIFATKIGESIAIDSVRYVVDVGVSIETKYDSVLKLYVFKHCPISQAIAKRRNDCAGNVSGGKCYRLYSKSSYDAFQAEIVPELLRVHLEKAVLQLFELGVALNDFDFLKDPSEMALNMTLDTLTRFGAISGNHITENGRWMTHLPFDFRLGFLIIEAKEMGLLNEALVLAAIINMGSDLSYRDLSESDAQVEARNKETFGVEEMDCFAWLKVYKTWKEQPKKEMIQWCHLKHINYKSLNSVRRCVEDARKILSMKFDIDLDFQFSSDLNDRVTFKLKRLLFKARNPDYQSLFE